MSRSRSLLIAALFAVLTPCLLAADPLVNRANLDTAAQPCSDFFRYANGGWIDRHPIPASEAGWGRFNEISQRNRETLRDLLTAAAAHTDAPAESIEGKVGAFYASCMDEAGIEARGLEPLRPEVDRIAAVHDSATLLSEVAHLQSMGVQVLFGANVGPDAHDSVHNILEVSQGGLGLPDRDYYFKDDAATKKIRDEYVQHVARMLELAGDAPDVAAKEAASVMALETRLASAAKNRAQRRDAEANYHKMTLAEMAALTPHLAWETWLRDLGIPAGAAANANVREPDFLKAVDHELTATAPDDWKIYLRWHLLNALGESLPSRFASEHFKFTQGVLQGTPEDRPRWDRCVRSTDRHLGMALGQLYAEKNFSPEARQRARAMVEQIFAALRDDLKSLPWMDETTRAAALRKLDAVGPNIGYPDHWLDYTGLAVERGSFVANVLRADERERHRRLAMLGKPVDRAEWRMTPATVNASYNPTLNEIFIPAGILQPPFFDAKADDAYNFGAAGSVIGHELTHGFDDQGAKFDDVGNLKNWWSPSDLTSFGQRAECVEKHFDGFPVQDLHENGKLVKGESIADLGGVKLAFKAYQRSLAGKPRQTIDGFTPEQRFFLGYAGVWGGSNRPENERFRVATDPHPLGKYRVNGTVSELPEFAAAFSCKAGDPMARPAEQRCAVW